MRKYVLQRIQWKCQFHLTEWKDRLISALRGDRCGTFCVSRQLSDDNKPFSSCALQKDAWINILGQAYTHLIRICGMSELERTQRNHLLNYLCYWNDIIYDFFHLMHITDSSIQCV